MTIGGQLRVLREEAKLSLREVSIKIGIDASLLGKIERNERQPTKEQLKQIADFFKIQNILPDKAVNVLPAPAPGEGLVFREERLGKTTPAGQAVQIRCGARRGQLSRRKGKKPVG